MSVRIEQVSAARTHPLRNRILRPHQTLEEMAWPGDDDAESAHFAAVDGDEVIGTASVLRETPPWASEPASTWRLRGMATAEDRRRCGVGAALLDAVMQHVRSHGGGLVWCNARTPAVRFYEHAGFVSRGEGWVDPVAGPHIAMWRPVEVAG
jgi:GNAT superfamily N-acetyltransferase